MRDKIKKVLAGSLHDGMIVDHIDVIVDKIAEAVQADSQVLTCIYCSHQYPPGTPSSNHQLLTEHIKVCDKHPMKKLNDQNVLLRDRNGSLLKALGEIRRALPCALIDLIGIDIFYNIVEHLYKVTGEQKFKCPVKIKEMVDNNKLGRKSGEGFYTYKK